VRAESWLARFGYEGGRRLDGGDEQRRSEQERFVEEMGIYMEQEGMPRMAGRILGWLLICDPPLQSASELAEALQASRGSISTMTQFLIRFGLLERVGVPGERQDYFRIRPHAAAHMFEEEVERLQSAVQLLERGLGLVADQPPDNQERLRELHDLYSFFVGEFPALLERWYREHEARTAVAQPVS
jgi:DNA-binding transcriptional regulator GbsR (MarR family)